MNARLDDWIRAHAMPRGLRVELVRAIVRVESGGNPDAVRYEPRYRWCYDARSKAPAQGAPRPPPGMPMSLATEEWGQKASWGGMQVMGAVARELGFLGWWPELCREAGIDYGCRHLQALIRRHGGEEAGIVAYNAGSPRRTPSGAWENQNYLDKVRAADVGR